MREKQVKQLLKKIRKVNIAVYGDFCLDAYWLLNPNGGEISVETGLRSQAVEKHYYTLGGASNIVANLAALKPAMIQAIGVVGDDIFGRELFRQLNNLGVDNSTIVIQKENYDTVTFSKRCLEDEEQPRIDFGFFNRRSLDTDQQLIAHLKNALNQFDAVIFNQQVPGIICNESFIDQANKLFQEYDDNIILFDSRHYGRKFHHVYRKINDIEIALLNGIDAKPGDVIPLSDICKYGQNLFQQSHKPVFITRGARDLITIDADGIHQTPGIQLLKKLDTVGAGDTIISALGLCLAAGCKPGDAAAFANLAAGVTVQKLFMTGTASDEEIIEISKDTDYIYQPELADDIRQARYCEESEIELCFPNETIQFGRIKHALFDHDGTISSLRQGWEPILEDVMIKIILGDQYKSEDETTYRKVLSRVRDYLDKSTGIQTILQMEALVDMTHEFGLVPQDQILDKFGYKKIYNDALMEKVNQRIQKLDKGKLDVADFTIKGAVLFLKLLRDRNIILYLASGTDRDDVVNEANLLGYAKLFNGGVWGAIGDVEKYSKKKVIEQIMTEHKLHGSEMLVIGDGPVEIRECRKRDGVAIGIASDEVRRYGLNKEKRTRLIKAGANIIIPDFSQGDRLLELLFNES